MASGTSEHPGIPYSATATPLIPTFSAGHEFRELAALESPIRFPQNGVNYPGLKAEASSFIGCCLSSDVLLRSYAASPVPEEGLSEAKH